MSWIMRAISSRVAGRRFLLLRQSAELAVLASFEDTPLPAEVAGLLDAWAGHDDVLVLDAVASGEPPGTLHRYAAADGPLPAAFSSFSTHGFGLAEAIELARALGKLPRRLTVYGIEGEDFRSGEGLTPAVEAAVGWVVSELGRDHTAHSAR